MSLALLFLCIGLTWFDLRTRRIPNTVTLPILLAGLSLHLPGTPETWLAAILLFSGWRLGWIGGGDAKLWMALLWIFAPDPETPMILSMVWFGTAIVQLALRWARGLHTFRAAQPAAWRAIPFVLWMAAFH